MDLLWETNGETMEELKEAGEMKGSVLELFRDELKDERILGYVESQRDEGKTDQEIIARIMSKFGLEKKDAEGYVLVPA